MKAPATLPVVELAQERVLGWQTKLHRWATEDEQARFGDLFNLLCDPATPRPRDPATPRPRDPATPRPRDPRGRVGAGEAKPGV